MNDKRSGSDVEQMPPELIKSNQLSVTGIVASEQEYSHDVFGEGFYKFTIETKRLSDASDFLPVIFSERICNREELTIGTPIEVVGQIRSYNNFSDSKSRLILTVFPKDITFLDEPCDKDRNEVALNGFICRKPIFRTTPFGREICDILVAVNRAYSKSDYIPLIAWGRNARFGGTLETGDEIHILGRMQSRAYQKKLDEETVVNKVAFEISVSKIEKK